MTAKDKLNVVSIRLKKDRSLMSDVPMDNPKAAVDAVGKYLAQFDREVVCVINVDSKLKPINCSFVSIGALDYSIASPREILKSAILSNAKGILLIHNHPSNDLSPSKADISLTDRMCKACYTMDINLYDHIIVGTTPGRYYSFQEKTCVLDTRNQPEFTTDINKINFSVADAVSQYMKENDVKPRRRGR